MPQRFAERCLVLIGLVVCGCGRDAGRADRPVLGVFCAAGMKEPISRIAEAYRRETGVDVQLQFGGTGTLMAQIEVVEQGDLFIAADAEAVEIVRRKGFVRETFPLAHQYPVVAVSRGNPLGVASLDDLFREDVRVAVGNPEAASIGKATRDALGGRWDEFRGRVVVMKPTVTELALDLRIGSVDAAVVWNSIVPLFEDLEAVRIPELEPFGEEVGVAVLTTSDRPDEAERFARYLAAPTKGAAVLSELGFDVVPGEPWAEDGEDGR